MRSARLLLILLGPGLYGIGLTTSAAQEPAAAAPSGVPGPVTQRSVEDVARERRQIATRSLEMLSATLERGAATASFIQDYYFWSSRLAGCEIFLNIPADQPRTMVPEIYLSGLKPQAGPAILDALQQHLKRMQLLDERYRRLEQQGILSHLDYQRILDHRIEAESWVLREQARRESR